MVKNTTAAFAAADVQKIQRFQEIFAASFFVISDGWQSYLGFNIYLGSHQESSEVKVGFKMVVKINRENITVCGWGSLHPALKGIFCK